MNKNHDFAFVHFNVTAGQSQALFSRMQCSRPHLL